MNEEQRGAVVRYWWSKAEDSLASARRELQAGSNVFAMNRVYYAAFYAVSAALLERKFQFVKHSGVRATFHREFVKTGLLDVKWGKLYDHFFEDRQEGDYVALTSFEREYVEMQLDQCVEFLATLRPLISALA
ncbi:MAG: hypothetical protein AUK03_10220 [Anaerolineae bacterium CG2_30_64_16]|nr:MAG: hypothetical protein AUK03_10220 [Anaerolineae bacterium CG2_30_64_16]